MDLVNILRRIREMNGLLRSGMSNDDKLYLKINKDRVVAIEELSDSEDETTKGSDKVI
jgi:azurin